MRREPACLIPHVKPMPGQLQILISVLPHFISIVTLQGGIALISQMSCQSSQGRI